MNITDFLATVSRVTVRVFSPARQSERQAQLTETDIGSCIFASCHLSMELPPALVAERPTTADLDTISTSK